MAWLTAYLPADQAAAIWNRTTAVARGLQGPDESRTLTQLRADAFATALLTSGTQAQQRQPGTTAATTVGSGDPAEHGPGRCRRRGPRSW